MTRTTTGRGGERELAQRTSGGVEVTLTWNERDGRLTVSVRDAATGEAFELEATPDEALEVFHHPYAYAASRGVGRARAERAVADAVTG